MRVRITWTEVHEWSLDVKNGKEAQRLTDTLDVPKRTLTCKDIKDAKWEAMLPLIRRMKK